MRVIVIMAGGSGTRFWPASRKHRPKQLLCLASDQPMLRDSTDHARDIVGAEQVYIVAGPHLEDALRGAIDYLPDENFIIEPEARNTAPCLALAAAVIARRHGPETSMGVMTSDHMITKTDTFARNMDLAFEHAEQNDALMTMGITPTGPETGFGYLEIGPALREDPRGSVHEVRAFKEKPDETTAKAYVDSGDYLWNSGMFFWRIETLLAAFDSLVPELGKETRRILTAPEDGFEATMKDAFGRMPVDSIDYAVMEKADNVCAVPSQFGWDDLGSWTALDATHDADGDGNIVVGKCVALDTTNCIIHNTEAPEASGGRMPLVATLGLDNLVIVNTGDAILVCPRDRAQDVKKVLERMREQGHEDYL